MSNEPPTETPNSCSPTAISHARTSLGWAYDECLLAVRGNDLLHDLYVAEARRHLIQAAGHLGLELVEKKKEAA